MASRQTADSMVIEARWQRDGLQVGYLCYGEGSNGGDVWRGTLGEIRFVRIARIQVREGQEGSNRNTSSAR